MKETNHITSETMKLTDKQKYGDTQKIKTKKEEWGYSYKHSRGDIYEIYNGGNIWYVEDKCGDWVAEGETKKEAIISLQGYLNI